MKNRAVINPPHLVDSTVFEPTTPSTSTAVMEYVELEKCLGSSDLSLVSEYSVTQNSTDATPTTPMMKTGGNRRPSSYDPNKGPPKKRKKLTKFDKNETEDFILYIKF